MTEKEIIKEQNKIIKHLKKGYPNKDIDVTSFFVKGRQLYDKNDIYLIHNVYGKIQDFVEFKNSFNGLLLIEVNTSDNIKVFAHLTERGYEYANNRGASIRSKWALGVAIASLVLAFSSFFYSACNTSNNNKEYSLFKKETQTLISDSLKNFRNYMQNQSIPVKNPTPTK